MSTGSSLSDQLLHVRELWYRWLIRKGHKVDGSMVVKNGETSQNPTLPSRPERGQGAALFRHREPGKGEKA